MPSLGMSYWAKSRSLEGSSANPVCSHGLLGSQGTAAGLTAAQGLASLSVPREKVQGEWGVGL